MKKEFLPEYFLARKEELSDWAKFLAEPDGQAIFIVGEEGSGKSSLLDQIIHSTLYKNELHCGVVRYDIAADESLETTLRFLMDDAFMAVRAAAGAVDNPGLRFWQWSTFFDGIGVDLGNLTNVQNLINICRFDPQKNIAGQFSFRLNQFSSLIKDNARAVIIFDCSGPMTEGTAKNWTSIIEKLPPKIKLVFSVLPKDALFDESGNTKIANIKLIPKREADKNASEYVGLKPLNWEETAAFVNSNPDFSPAIKESFESLFKQYKGNPYMVRSALLLLRYFPDVKVADLPKDVNAGAISTLMWNKLKSLGPEVINLFRAYSILGEVTSDEIVMRVADLDLASFKKTLDIPVVRALIRTRADGHRIADKPLGKVITEDTDTDSTSSRQDFHRRAVIAYESLLHRSLRPDPTCAIRIPEHAYEIAGPYAYISYASDMVDPLLSLCHFDAAQKIVKRAIELVEPDSREAGQMLYKIGLIQMARGNLVEAKGYITNSLRTLRTAGDSDTLPDVLFTLGKIIFQEKKYRESEKLLLEAYNGYVINDDPQGMVDIATLLGEVLVHLGLPSQAEETLLSALETSELLDYNRNRLRAKANVHCALGKIYEARDDNDRANEQYNIALDLTQDICDRESEAVVYTNLYQLVNASGGWEKALVYQNKALAIHTELRNLNEMVIDHLNLSYINEKLDNKADSLEHLYKAKEICVQLGNAEKSQEISYRILRHG
ncbi:MAG: tetratricopeptide repeat protein [Thermoguttaceae bacterium]